MSVEQNPEAFTGDGTPWAEDEERDLFLDNTAAILEEHVVHSAAMVREIAFSRLAALRALQDGFGWVMFDDEVPGDLADTDSREVLVFSGPVADTSGPGNDLIVPYLRIITSESYVRESEVTYLAEDITIRPDGTAVYDISTVLLDHENNEQLRGAIIESPVALVTVIDGKLAFIGNTNDVTTVSSLHSSDGSRTVTPFGDGGRNTEYDQHYALDKAVEILGSVAHLTPFAQYTF
jgi:hypothetical protein